MPKSQTKPNRPKVSLALQGGGSHGAYTWGVLDRLLEEEDLIIEAISGTSAGAMNAIIMIDGYIKNGRKGAKSALATFWRNISEMGKFSPFNNSPLQSFNHNWNLDASPSYAYFDILTQVFSPYQLNPFNINPLKDMIQKMVDFKALQNSDIIQLFVTATSVTTGQPHIFSHKDITIDALMASSCLPSMFQAIKIGNDHYWDGGFAGNPSIWPLTYHSYTSDIVIVEINPVVRKTIPMKGNEIENRVNEISFNASLIAEIRFINFINKLIDKNHIATNEYRKINMHLIESVHEMLELNASSKLNTSREFLTYLHGLGRVSAEKWLEKNFDSLGICSSVDVKGAYLCHTKKSPSVEKQLK